MALQARVFDFLWEHHPQKDHRDALRAVDAYLDMAKIFSGDEKTWMTTVDAFDRAMALACQINDRPRAKACRDNAITHLRLCCSSERWAELCDLTTCFLALRDSKFKDLLVTEVLNNISSLIDIAATEHQKRGDHHGEMHFLKVLCVIRRIQGGEEGERTVMVRQAQTLHTHADREAVKNNWRVAASFYTHAVAAYQRAGDVAAADQMKMRASYANEKAVEQMKPSEGTIRLPREAVDEYIRIFTEAPDLATALIHVAADPQWLLDVEHAAKMATETEQVAPFYSMVSKQVIRDDRVAATASSPEERHKYLEMQAHSQKMYVFLQLRHEAFSRLRGERGLCSGDVMAHLEGWSLMPTKKIPFFRRAIQAYFEGDYVVALHLLIPHLEDLLRRILRFADVPSRGFSSDGTQTEQVLGDVLRNPKVVAVIGEPLQRTLLFVMTDEQGFNLRNLVAHGMVSDHQCTTGAVEVILWLLLSLTVLRRTGKDMPSDSDVTAAAFRRWQARGGGHGRDREDWFAAINDLAPGVPVHDGEDDHG